jgi:magnesium transporter
VSFVDQAGDGWLCAEAKAHLHATQRDVQSLSDHATFTSGKINFLLDASLGLINNNLNRQMKVLSAIMIAVMWPALVSGFFAMNVKLPMPQPPDRAEMWPFYLCLGLAFGPLLIGFGMWWWRPRR